MSFSKGDKVLIDYMGSPYNKAEGIVVGRNENGMWLVSIDNNTPEPKWVEFTGHHLQFLEAADHEENAIKDSGERTKKPQENNGVNIWIKNAFGMGTIIIEVIGGDVHLFMENQKQDCTIVGQI